MMSVSEWIGLITIICGFLGTACGVAYSHGRLTGKLDGITRLVEKLVTFYDQRPCAAHKERLDDLERRIDRLNGG